MMCKSSDIILTEFGKPLKKDGNEIFIQFNSIKLELLSALVVDDGSHTHMCTCRSNSFVPQLHFSKKNK